MVVYSWTSKIQPCITFLILKWGYLSTYVNLLEVKSHKLFFTRLAEQKHDDFFPDECDRKLHSCQLRRLKFLVHGRIFGYHLQKVMWFLEQERYNQSRSYLCVYQTSSCKSPLVKNTNNLFLWSFLAYKICL